MCYLKDRKKDKMQQKNLYAIDLFCGCGGTTCGLEKANIKVKTAVEINPVAVKTYTENNKGISVITDDIRNVSGKMLREKSGVTKNDRLLLVACPPCQGFSAIRKGGEDDKRNQLVFEFIRLIKELEPDFILMENVAGMSKGKGKTVFSKALGLMEKDYECLSDVLNAADYGVPQTRKRLVLHGIRKDLLPIIVEKGLELSLPEKTNMDPRKKGNLPKWKTASVILGLPPIGAGDTCNADGICNHTSNGMSEINIRRIRYIREHGGDRRCLPESLALPCHKGKCGHTDVYGIMDMEKPAPTITGGCMHYSKGRYGHPNQDRALSAREAARLQSFDDKYFFYGSNAEVALQIGNAVPVELAKASGKYFVSLFEALNS